MAQATSVQKRPVADAEPAAAATIQAARRKSQLLEAAWTAAGIARRPPQQKRSHRRITAASRALSPRLLSPERFSGWQPAPPPAQQPPASQPPVLLQPLAQPLAEVAVPEELRLQASPLRVVSVAAPALPEMPRQASPLPIVSLAPALPELPPIAPLDLQPLRVALAADVPPPPAGHGGAASRQQPIDSWLAVQAALPAFGSGDALASDAWAAAGPFYLPATPTPNKRPGGALQLCFSAA